MKGHFISILLLCWLCSMVMGKDKEMMFYWLNFNGKEGEVETLADYTQLKLGAFKLGSTNIQYVEGMFEYKVEIDDTDPFTVDYTLKLSDTFSNNYNGPRLIHETLPICDFFTNVFRAIMLPMMDNRNDFPKRTKSACPILKREYNIFPLKNVLELGAPSDLISGKYLINVTILKDDVQVGGFEGEFIAITLPKNV